MVLVFYLSIQTTCDRHFCFFFLYSGSVLISALLWFQCQNAYYQIPDTKSQSQKITDQLQIWQSQIPDMKSQISDMKIQISDAHFQVPGQISYVSDISGIHCPQIQMRYLVSGNLSVSVSAQALPKNSIFKKLTKKSEIFFVSFWKANKKVWGFFC